MADPVHALHPARVLAVDLGEPHDRHDAEEVDDGQQDEGEGDERRAGVGRLGDERERDDGARERGDVDRRPAHRLRVHEAARSEEAPVLGRQDLERVRAEVACRRARMRGDDARGRIGLEHDGGQSRAPVGQSRRYARYWYSCHEGTGASSSSVRPPFGSA